MPQLFLKSEKVHVYPSAYRGFKTEGGESRVIDPASRLNIEENIIKVINSLASKDSFVISDNYAIDNTIECSIHGYWFKLDLSEVKSNFAKKKYVYAKILLQPKNDSTLSITDYQAVSLSSLKVVGSGGGETVSDQGYLDDATDFCGLEIILSDTEISVSEPYHTLLLLVYIGGNTYIVPNSSKLKITSESIENLFGSGIDISKIFTTQVAKITNGTSTHDVSVDSSGNLTINPTSGSGRIEISADGKTIKKFDNIIGGNCIYKVDEYGNTGNYDFSIPTHVWDNSSGTDVNIRDSLVFSGAKFEKITHLDDTVEYSFDLATSSGKMLYAFSSSGNVDSWWKGLDYQKANFAYDSIFGILTITYES